jgi:hypothetical protein
MHLCTVQAISYKTMLCSMIVITLKEYQLFDLKVKGQIEVTMEHDTPSYDYTPTYQISLIYRKRQKSYGPYKLR